MECQMEGFNSSSKTKCWHQKKMCGHRKKMCGHRKIRSQQQRYKLRISEKLLQQQSIHHVVGIGKNDAAAATLELQQQVITSAGIGIKSAGIGNKSLKVHKKCTSSDW
jgi:hypothetical protein